MYSRKILKELKEAEKNRDKDDLYYKQVDFDPYAPRYTFPQLATTAGGLAGTTLGSQVGMRLGQSTKIPGAGIVGLGVGGALGGALGSIGAYQLAKMARPKKKKPKKLVQYYR